VIKLYFAPRTRAVRVLDERYPRVNAYLARLAERPAFKKAAASE